MHGGVGDGRARDPPMRKPRRTLTWASPPRMNPVATWAKRRSLRVTPSSFIRLLARMKVGMARREKFWVSARASCTGMVS